MPPLRIKICGVTTPADLAAAVAAGADAIGLNFHPSSPRFVIPAMARQFLRLLPPFVEAVGVFVSRPVAEACAFLDGLEGPIHTVQMHAGRPEPPPARFRLIPAYQVREAGDLEMIAGQLSIMQASAVLVDGHAAGLHGGTGRVAPWDVLAGWSPGVPVILAGGLTPENVAEAVRRVRPFGIDVASGVESSPGRKCPDKMRRFIDAARGA